MGIDNLEKINSFLDDECVCKEFSKNIEKLGLEDNLFLEKLRKVERLICNYEEHDFGLTEVYNLLNFKPDIIYAPALSGMTIALVLKGFFDFIKKENPNEKFKFPPICVVWEKVRYYYFGNIEQIVSFRKRICRRIIKLHKQRVKLESKIGFIDDCITRGTTFKNIKGIHNKAVKGFFRKHHVLEHESMGLYHILNDISTIIKEYIFSYYKHNVNEYGNIDIGIVPRFGYKNINGIKFDFSGDDKSLDEVGGGMLQSLNDRKRIIVMQRQKAVYSVLKYLGYKIGVSFKERLNEEFCDIIKIYKI